MPVTRQQIRDDEQRVVISFNNTTETLTIWIAPNRVTPEFMRRAKAAQTRYQQAFAERERERNRLTMDGKPIPEELADDMEIDRAFMVENMRMILDVATRWDMLETMPTDEQPYPPTVPITFAELDALGFPVINRVISEITESMRVNPTKSNDTGNGYRPTAITVINPNGQGRS